MSSEPESGRFSDTPIDALVASVVRDLDGRLRTLIETLLQNAAAERDAAVAAAVADARDAAARERDVALQQADARLADASEQGRREADRRVEEAVAEARDAAARELDAALQQADARLADAAEQARREADRRVEEAVADVLARQAAERAATPDASRTDVAASQPFAGTGEPSAQMELDAARAQAARAESALEAERTVRVGERESMLDELDRLRDAVVALDAATSLTECLDRLADSVAAHAPRSALLVLRGSSLRGWRFAGFGDAAPTAESVVLPLEAAGPFREVVARGTPQPILPEQLAALAGSALGVLRLAEGRVGFAVPVTLDERTVAVAYADDGDVEEREVPTGWPEALDVLARHASRCLQVLTAGRRFAMVAPDSTTAAGAVSAARGPASGGPANPSWPGGDSDADTLAAAERYARIVVSEIKLYNEGAIRVARHKRDIRTRLRAEIHRARRMYEEHVPASLPQRDELFERELVRVLADGQPELLGAHVRDAV